MNFNTNTQLTTRLVTALGWLGIAVATPGFADNATLDYIEALPHKECSQEELEKKLAAVDKDGKVTLDGNCRYVIKKINEKADGRTSTDGLGATAYYKFNIAEIDGQGAIIQRDRAAPNFRFFVFAKKEGTTIKELMLVNAASEKHNGGAIFGFNDLTLDEAVFIANKAGAPAKKPKQGRGGAVAIQNGKLVVKNSRFVQNQSNDAGAAIYAQSRNVEISNSFFWQNTWSEAQGPQAAVTLNGTKNGGVTAKVSNVTMVGTYKHGRVSIPQGTAIHAAGNLTVKNSIFRSFDTGLSAFANHKDKDDNDLDPDVLEEEANIFQDVTHLVHGRANIQLKQGATRPSVRQQNAPFTALTNYVGIGFSDIYTPDANLPAVDYGVAFPEMPLTDMKSQKRPFSKSLPDVGLYEFQGSAERSVSLEFVTPKWTSAGQTHVLHVAVRNNRNTTVNDLSVNVDAHSELSVLSTFPGRETDPNVFLGKDKPADKADAPNWKINLGPYETKLLSYRVKMPDSFPDKSPYLAYMYLTDAQGTVDPEYIPDEQGKPTKTLAPTGYAMGYAWAEFSDGTHAAGDSDERDPKVRYKVLSDSGFRPHLHGLSFENYTTVFDDDFTLSDMIDVFGEKAVCSPNTLTNSNGVQSCTPLARIPNYLKAFQNTGKGGHCVGLAFAALQMFEDGASKPATLQAGTHFGIDVYRQNLRKRIARFAMLQSTEPVTKMESSYPLPDPKTKKRHPKLVVEKLIENLSNENATDRYTLSVTNTVKGAKKGGHRVVPYAVEKARVPGVTHHIFVYDPNDPKASLRTVAVNVDTGAWSYKARIDPSKPDELYQGTADTDTLYLVSLNHAAATPRKLGRCTADKDYVSYDDKVTKTKKKGCLQWSEIVKLGSGVTYLDGAISVRLDGQALPLVTRSDGARVGFDVAADKWVSEIPGARQRSIERGYEKNHAPVIELPHTPGFTYDVKAFADGTRDDVQLFLEGPLFSAHVDGLNVVPGRGATFGVALSVDDKSLAIRSNTEVSQTATVLMSSVRPGETDVRAEIKDVALASGETVGLGIDESNGALRIEDQNGADTSYDVTLSRFPTDGPSQTHSGSFADGGQAGIEIGTSAADWTDGSAPKTQLHKSSKVTSKLVNGEDIATYLDGMVRLRSSNFPDYSLKRDDTGKVRLIVHPEQPGDDFYFDIHRVGDAHSGFSGNIVEIRDQKGNVLTMSGQKVSFVSAKNGKDIQETQFRVVPGLGNGGLSFEAAWHKGFYLRHSSYELRLNKTENTDLFHQDATFFTMSKSTQ